jgi:Ni/Co efflux regulator RcnB
MRILALAAVAAAMTLAASPADAQRYPSRPGGQMPGAPAPAPMPGSPNPGGWSGGNNGGGRWNNGGNWNGGARPQPVRGPSRGGRWGNRINGYWYAGVQAPGGWKGYRQMRRGRTLPRYWISPSFFISDFANYGLNAPLNGYYWTRYYNDAVMVDRYGHVYDTVGGIDWDRDGGYDDGYADDGAGYDAPGYGAGYPPPGGPGYGGPRGPGYGESSSTYYSSTTAGGFGGPGYPGGPRSTYVVRPGTIATVTVPGAVTTTTTTEEIIEEYAPRPTVVVKRVYRPARKRVWRPRPKPRCGCGS